MWSQSNVGSNDCGLKWLWSQMTVVSNDCGLKWMWSQMKWSLRTVCSNECGLKWLWSQMNVVSNEWSQMNGLKWIGLNSHGTAAANSRRHMKLRDHWYKNSGCKFVVFEARCRNSGFFSALGFFEKQKSWTKPFFSRKILALEKYCLSCVFIANFFRGESMTMQGAKKIAKILLFHSQLSMYLIKHKCASVSSRRNTMLLKIGILLYWCFWGVLLYILCLVVHAG